LSDGRKATVLLDGIYPFFEVRIPDDDDIEVSQEQYKNQIIAILKKGIPDDQKSNHDISPYKVSVFNAKPFKYFQEHKSKYLRLYYQKSTFRKRAILELRKRGYETASDDLSCYYRVVCRNYRITFSSWSVLTDYKIETNSSFRDPIYRLNIRNYLKLDESQITEDLMQDKTMSVCWDIETYSPSGDLPDPENKTDCICCISMTFQWIFEREPFLKIAICDYDCAPHPDFLTVVCGSEDKIIKAFARIFGKLSPEYIIGFNDTFYDWPWVVERASQTKGLLKYIHEKMDMVIPYKPKSDNDVKRWNYKVDSIKIDAETTVSGHSLQFPGYLSVDVRTVFRKLYPTSEKNSLQWFLQQNNLGSKEDMPFKRMFRIYRQIRQILNNKNVTVNSYSIDIDSEVKDPLPPDRYEDKDLSETDDLDFLKGAYLGIYNELTEVNKYCVVDARKCHDLMKARSVIMDKREVANLSFCSPSDAFIRADGMKVRNLTISEGQLEPFKLRFSNITIGRESDAKYPGAYVFPPDKGLKVSKLSIKERIKKSKIDNSEWKDVSEEDVKKFHGIVETYGAICNENKIKQIEEKEGKLPKYFKEFLSEKIGRPITGLDFSSLYPSLIRAYNFSPEYCNWSADFLG
jgi:DNA polymerase elongation subunit (family B)